MTYLIFLEFWSQSVCFVQLAPILKPWTCNKIGLITSIPAPCLNISRKDFLLSLWCLSSGGFMESSPSVFLTPRVNTSPGCSHDLLFGLGYANELFSSFHSFFIVILSCLCLPSCLSLSLHLLQRPEWPFARFPAFLFLCLSSCYSPSRSVCYVQLHSVCFLKMTLIIVTFLIGCPGSANQSSKRETGMRNNGLNCLHFHKIIHFSLIPWITAKVFGVTEEKYS